MTPGVFVGKPFAYQQRLFMPEHWLESVDFYSEKWPEPQKERLVALKAKDVRVAYWRSDKDGNPCNGGMRYAPVTAGMVQTVAGPLVICSKQALHATLRPPRWNGSRLWVVALHGEVIGDAEKFGALKREILGEAENHPWV